jgi:hypothetical protein
VGAEDDALQTLDPFLGALRTVGAEVIGAMVGGDSEVHTLLIFIGNCSRDAIAKVDLAMRKVQVRRIAIVREDVAFQAEPVAVVLGVTFPTLGQVPGLCDLMLWTVSNPEWEPNRHVKLVHIRTAFFGRYA